MGKLMQRQRCHKIEFRDFHAEAFSVFGYEEIASHHTAGGGVQWAGAVVFESLPGMDLGL